MDMPMQMTATTKILNDYEDLDSQTDAATRTIDLSLSLNLPQQSAGPLNYDAVLIAYLQSSISSEKWSTHFDLLFQMADQLGFLLFHICVDSRNFSFDKNHAYPEDIVPEL